MAIGYLILALVLAVTLNSANRWVRMAGTVLVALGLVMMILSIGLADFDGTFANVPASATLIDRITPAILNVQAVLASGTVVFLLWSAWRQAARREVLPLPLRNTATGYGSASRLFHWTIAVAMFCLMPIGLFMAILPAGNPERAGFVAAHQALGLTVLLLVAGRIGWLMFSPPPPAMRDLTRAEGYASRAVHVALYLVLLTFPVSGYLLSAAGGAGIDFYGFAVPVLASSGDVTVRLAAMLHNWLLPALFYLAIALHIAAVLKRHFWGGPRDAVRRMLR